ADITVNSGGTFTNTSNNNNVSINGNISNGGTLNAGTGTYTFTGSGKTIGGANAVSIPTVSISGSYTNNGTFTVGTGLAGAGSLTNSAAGILNLGGSTTTITTLTATASGNTVNYNGAAQTVKPVSYYNLTLSGTSAKTMTGVSTIS